MDAARKKALVIVIFLAVIVAAAFVLTGQKNMQPSGVEKPKGSSFVLEDYQIQAEDTVQEELDQSLQNVTLEDVEVEWTAQ